MGMNAQEKICSLLKKRISIASISEKDFGKEVVVAGFVKKIRNLGKNLKFLILSDFSGEIQLSFKREIFGELKPLDELTLHSFILAKGEACKGLSKRGKEIVAKEFYVLSKAAQPIPIEIEHIQTGLDNRLDYRWIDLRNPKHRFPLVLLSEFVRYTREFFNQEGFVEIFTPKLVGSPTESGAEAFSILYFDKTAYLAQSPQFYKQMAICSGFEKVFEIAPVFRAEPSFTTRHATEFTSLDVEIAYIASHHDIMDFEEEMLNYVFKRLKEEWGEKIENEFGCELNLPNKIPRIKMEDAYKIVSKKNISEKGDLRPEGEKEIFEFVKKKHKSDFVFITDFPYSARPFYHMKGEPMKNGEETTKSFDLIYRGIEITTGAQREHRYEILVNQAREKGLNLANLDYFFNFFKYGAPPHGGFGFGLSRTIMALLGFKNIREATFIPRDPRRLFP